jgi:DNA-binding PadR family transcriptional regulator
MFEGGALRLVLLEMMRTQPRHGYELIREIETQSGGAYAPSPGVVYPTLTLLEEMGHIAAAPGAVEGGKRAYVLAEAGAAYLAEHAETAQLALAKLAALRAESGAAEAGPVWRAMQNLRAVLGQKRAGGADREAQFAVADVIDDAAKKIERMG